MFHNKHKHNYPNNKNLIKKIFQSQNMPFTYLCVFEKYQELRLLTSFTNSWGRCTEFNIESLIYLMEIVNLTRYSLVKFWSNDSSKLSFRRTYFCRWY